MDDMTIARINGGIIAWARRRTGATIDSLSTRAISPASISAWEKGDSFPSEGQAEVLAERLGIAYAMLYMPNVPPDEKIDIPDLRTLGGAPLTRPSLNFLKVLDDTIVRQEWYRAERLGMQARRLRFASKFSLNDDPAVVAADMRRELSLGTSMRSACRNFDDFLKTFVSNAELVGVLVMRSSIAGHSTTKRLDVEEFRGFALIDDIAPVVFINDNDAKAAQIFTLAHELTHIWIGEGGISDREPDDKRNSKNEIELFCDEVAAELLVPAAEVASVWKDGIDAEENISRISRHFKVSTLVSLRRAKDLKRITSAFFYAKVKERYEWYKRQELEKREKAAKKEKKGGNCWASFELRNSAKFNAAVVEAINQQRSTYTEASALFGVSLSATTGYLRRVEARK